MNNDISNLENQLKELKLDNILSVAIIVFSLFNIIGDLIEQESITTNDQEKKKISHDLYTLSIIGSIILYSIFYKRSKKSLINSINSNEEIKPHYIRYIGSIFFVIGILCIFYYNIKDKENIDSPEI